MQCKKGNLLARSGAGAREKTYTVALCQSRDVIQLKMENEKKLQKFKQRKKFGQKSQKYLELKDGQKIGILNDACSEENLSNQMPTSNGMVGNKSVTVLRNTGCFRVIVKRVLVAEEQLTGKVRYTV